MSDPRLQAACAHARCHTHGRTLYVPLHNTAHKGVRRPTACGHGEGRLDDGRNLIAVGALQRQRQDQKVRRRTHVVEKRRQLLLGRCLVTIVSVTRSYPPCGPSQCRHTLHSVAKGGEWRAGECASRHLGNKAVATFSTRKARTTRISAVVAQPHGGMQPTQSVRAGSLQRISAVTCKVDTASQREAPS